MIVLKRVKITCRSCGLSFTLITNEIGAFTCPHCKKKHENKEAKTE